MILRRGPGIKRAYGLLPRDLGPFLADPWWPTDGPASAFASYGHVVPHNLDSNGPIRDSRASHLEIPIKRSSTRALDRSCS
jgi:hypothetical protein